MWDFADDDESYVLPPVDVSEAAETDQIGRLNEFSFELYKEALSLVNFVGHLCDENDLHNGWPRNQAICAGLLIRLSKFMLVVVQLSSGNGNRADIVQALNRSILETAISLEFLAKSKDDKYFDQFVTAGLGPERELFELIQINIQGRNGEILPIEQRMLNSIHDCCRASGVTIEDVQKKHKEWGGNLRSRLEAIGKENWYTSAIRLPSHAVHGDWIDLYKNHLREVGKTGRFVPDGEIGHIDERLLGPVAMFVLNAIGPYMLRYFGSHDHIEGLLRRLSDLEGRLRSVGEAHEKLMSSS